MKPLLVFFFLAPICPRTQKHAHGIEFIEWNAGRNLDSHMKWEGFRITVRLDPLTGLLYGGSSTNCGTWMDKMGESGAHGTDGVPGTPRDGAAIEITSLLYSTLDWLTSSGPTGAVMCPVPAVTLADGTLYTLAAWKSALLVRSPLLLALIGWLVVVAVM